MRRIILIIAVMPLLIISCKTFHGIEPIYPEVGFPDRPKEVDSLQPTFRWNPLPDPNITYDLIIYECIKSGNFWIGIRRSVGREVYYREGIKGTEHKIEQTLKPQTEYYWTIRSRIAEKVSKWTLYDYKDVVSVKATNFPFMRDSRNSI